MLSATWAHGAENLLEQANSLRLTGRYEEAEELYVQAAEEAPLAAALGRSASLAARGDVAEAETILKSATEEHPQAAAPVARLAELAFARGDFKEAEFVLRQLSQETGGRVFFPSSVSELPKIYEQISEELASQYTIAYSSKNTIRNGAWRRIVVKVARPGVVARTRQGYYGPTSQ